MKKVVIWIVVVLVIILFVVFIFFFLDTFDDASVQNKNLDVLKEDLCIEISKLAKQNAQSNILEECKKYYEKSCTNNNNCGAFPCNNNKCLIRPCNSDSECPTLCGLHTTPVPGFCTTIDVK